MATKTRVHDLAAEFGITSEELLKLLAEAGIHVRSHLSTLDDGQVAILRARREREKRRAQGDGAPTKKRRRAKAKTTKARKKTPKAAKAEEAPEPTEPRPRRRRRTAAEVAAREAEEQAREAAQAEKERAIAEEAERRAAAAKPSLEERAAALFREPAVDEPTEAPPTPEEIAAEAVAAEESETAPPAPASDAEPTSEPAEQPAAQAPPAGPAETPRSDGRESVKPLRVPRPPSGARPIRPVASAAPGEQPEDRRRDKKKRRKGKRSKVDRETVQANISKTMATLKSSSATGRKGRRRDEEPSAREREEQRRLEEREREKTLVRVNEFITVSELAGILGLSQTDIVSFCFKELGMMVTVNQRLDFDQIELIAGEYGFQAIQEEEYAPTDTLREEADDEPEENLQPRPPVVTVMGHVDHGKTSLLDHVRKTNVIAGESGGITQHIGAYHVRLDDGRGITFLDTPGHEAFTAMRARGAQVTDLVVLVVAADDQVMPQTIEAISHARNAGVPLIVAINKIDLPAANVEKVKQDLLQHQVVLEEFGGDVLAQPISAKQGTGVDQLLEKILLQAELLDKQANPERDAVGVVVESMLDPGKGPVATILVQKGTLTVGQDFICGSLSGRVRAMLDERGNRLEAAGPSMPAQVLGLDGVPLAGDHFMVVTDGQQARDIAQKRQRLDREAQHRRSHRGISLEDLSRQIEEGEAQNLKIIIKADQGGPAEALADAFARLSTDEVRVDVIHRGVGAITESDVLLAKASNAIVVGFHVRPDANARSAAEREDVDIRTYRVIYEAVEEIKSALEGMLSPEEKEVVLGEATVKQTFKISGVGVIAGCEVTDGTIRRSARLRVVRDGVQVYDGEIASFRRFQDDVREVKAGLECGIGVKNFNDIKVGDTLEAYEVEQIQRTIQVTDAFAPAGTARVTDSTA